jgi:dihydropteroate synthase
LTVLGTIPAVTPADPPASAVEAAQRGLVMGVLNVTPDSFSDGGRWFTPAAALAHGRVLVAEGADVVDVGGESTRPGAMPVSEDEELRRILPVIEALAPEVRVSVDTRHAGVARAAVAAGATLINDVSASLHQVAAETGAGWVAMHMRGEPATMQADIRYEGDDVVGAVRAFLDERAAAARAAGVGEVWVDPGIGFGKTRAHNLALLRHLDAIVALGHPVVVGTSRKSFLGALTARSDAAASRRDRRGNAAPHDPATNGEPSPTPADDRLEASVATATWAFAFGARMVRAHDVRATVHAAKVVGPPARLPDDRTSVRTSDRIPVEGRAAWQ